MKTQRVIVLLCCLVLTISGCQPVDQQWIGMLSNNGLAIVFAMFCIFVISPAVGFAVWQGCRWLGSRGDKLLDQHTKWMAELVDSNKKMAECLSPLVDKLDKLVESEPVWHQKKFEKLQIIHEDIKHSHNKLDDIHKAVVLKVKHG